MFLNKNGIFMPHKLVNKTSASHSANNDNNKDNLVINGFKIDLKNGVARKKIGNNNLTITYQAGKNNESKFREFLGNNNEKQIEGMLDVLIDFKSNKKRFLTLLQMANFLR